VRGDGGRLGEESLPVSWERNLKVLAGCPVAIHSGGLGAGAVKPNFTECHASITRGGAPTLVRTRGVAQGNNEAVDAVFDVKETPVLWHRALGVLETEPAIHVAAVCKGGCLE
jgi:hypothetical protein